MDATGLDDREAASQKSLCREKVGIGGRVRLGQGLDRREEGEEEGELRPEEEGSQARVEGTLRATGEGSSRRRECLFPWPSQQGDTGSLIAWARSLGASAQGA